MTPQDYGNAFESGFPLTVRFLTARGLSYDSARELAQAAWTRGWKRLDQLRNPKMILAWMNSIALNIYRSDIRKEPPMLDLPELRTPPAVDIAAIDVHRVLNSCNERERRVLERYYIDGYEAREIARQEGCSAAAVRIRLLRARRSLSKLFHRRPVKPLTRVARDLKDKVSAETRP